MLNLMVRIKKICGMSRNRAFVHSTGGRLKMQLFCFVAKPQVLLIGQYSVGKTSFIRYLLGRDFPGQRIGPEPTTDRFTGTS